jgi:predicted DNA binding protein
MSVYQVPEGEEASHRQVELKLWHPGCWTLEVTDGHSDTHVIEKSLYISDDRIKGDFVLVSEGDVPIATFIEGIGNHRVVHGVTVLKRTNERARVLVNYERSSSIVPEIVNSEFMPIEPVHITEGFEYWTVLVRADRLEEVFRELEEEYDVDLQSIHEADPADSVEFADVIDRVYDQLSPRQLECLFEASDAGYYNWPREISATDVAERLGVSSPTFLEHLRKGEQKALDMVLAELEKRHRRS